MSDMASKIYKSENYNVNSYANKTVFSGGPGENYVIWHSRNGASFANAFDTWIDSNIEVLVISLTTNVNEPTITEIEVSISIISWWNQINDE